MVRITVSGLPGSGTTTACKALQERLKIDYVYAGQIFRLLAKEHGMDLTQFGRYCEQNPEVDKKLDDRQLALLHKDRILIEGRLSGWIADANNIPALKVWLDADVDVRAARIVQREGGEPEARKAEMLEREFSENRRYRSYYGVDLENRDWYDLVVDTDHLTPKEVVEGILEALDEMIETEGDWELPHAHERP